MTGDPAPGERVYDPRGRTCRVCGSDSLCSPREAKNAFPSFPWGDRELADDAHRICSFCKSAFYEHGKRTDDGTVYWVRLVTLKERAYQLSQAGNKTRDEYQDRLTAGPATATPRSDLS